MTWHAMCSEEGINIASRLMSLTALSGQHSKHQQCHVKLEVHNAVETAIHNYLLL